MVEVTQEDLFGNEALCNFFELMRDVLYFRDLIKHAKDYAVRGTDDMDPQEAANRAVILSVIEGVLHEQLQHELDNALGNLEYFYTARQKAAND